MAEVYFPKTNADILGTKSEKLVDAMYDMARRYDAEYNALCREQERHGIEYDIRGPLACAPKGVEGVDGIPSERLAVIVNPSKNIPDWSKEILKFQSGDEEVTEVQGTPVPQTVEELNTHVIGSMLRMFAPGIRDAAKLIGNEEAIDTVLDAMGGSPYMENLDELTPEQIAIHNPPVKPVYRIPPRPEPKPRKEVSKRKSVAKAARKRAQAGRKKNRG